jgi:ribosomal protein L11 methyltransferase
VTAKTAANESAVARIALDRASGERILAALDEFVDPERTACSLFETAPGRWTLSVHFRDTADAAVIQTLVANVMGPGAAGTLTIETIAETDWVAASLAGLAPVTAGRFVVHGAHDRARVPANRIGIEIEAALAFGTGHHGTTRGCLLALDAVLKARQPRHILDIGTGTGVLAIAAARTLHRPVLASDIDARAVETAQTNALINHAGPLVEIVRAAGLEHPRIRQRAPFDLVLANILLGPLQRLAWPIGRVLAPQARVILSGVLATQSNAALAAYRLQGLTLERCIPLDEWVTLVLRRGAETCG